MTVGEQFSGTGVPGALPFVEPRHLVFDFRTIETPWSATAWAESQRIQDEGYVGDKWPTLVLSNHDRSRQVSRLRHGKGLHDLDQDALAKAAAVLLLASRGTPFLYYGEEIGQVGRKPDEMIRNPMPWTPGSNGGFTQAARTWEPLQRGHERRNVATQAADPTSLLAHYRRWIRLRQAEPALMRGDFRLLELGRDDVIGWQRSAQGRTLTFVANLGPDALDGITLPADVAATVAVDRLAGEPVDARVALRLEPYGVRLYTSAP
jgi:alpha-glucosidase